MNLFDVYPLFDVEIVRGRGCRTFDKEGREYLDLYGGHAVISIGHSHPHYLQKMQAQMQKLIFYSNSVQNTLQQELARKLGRLSGYDDYSLFLINSGAEANENALKLASFYNGRKKVIAWKGAFHGRTAGAVGVTDNPRIKAPINQAETEFVPMNDAKQVEDLLEQGDVCALIAEGIQGISGIHVPDDACLRRLQLACERTNTVLILDEIQSGYGRSGKFFAHQHAGIRPDIITVAKGMGNGFPIGGVLISPKFTPFHGMLGTTFGGNHLACAAAIAVLDILQDEQLIANAARVGTYLKEALAQLPQIKEVRGRGLMIGLEFAEPVQELRKQLLYRQRVFTGASGTHVMRLLPPLCLSREEADLFLQRLETALKQH